MSDLPELKPCPFCGSKDISDSGHSTYRWAKRKDINKWWPDGSVIEEDFSVNCKHCFSSTRGTFGGQQTKELAITAWNRRAAQPNPGYFSESSEITKEQWDNIRPPSEVPIPTVEAVPTIMECAKILYSVQGGENWDLAVIGMKDMFLDLGYKLCALLTARLKGADHE